MKFQNVVVNLVTPGARRRQAGVTMIELLIVIAIAGILAMIAVPSLQSVLRSMRQNSAAGLLMSDLNMARGEAIKRNARILVCARDSAGANCSTSWTAGWVVCVEDAVPNQCTVASSAIPTPVLAVRPPLDPSLTLGASSATVAGVTVVRFSADSSQSSEKVTGTRDGAISLALGGTWSGATTRTTVVAVTGNISRP